MQKHDRILCHSRRSLTFTALFLLVCLYYFQNWFVTVIVTFACIVIAFKSWLSHREIQKYIQEREMMTEKLSHLYRFAEFGRLSSGMFHDLMNPLSVVSMHINKLEACIPKDKENVKCSLECATKASRRMEQYMSTIRRQIHSPEIEEYFSLNEGIQSSIELLKYKALKNNVTIVFKASHEIRTQGNPIKFQHVIVNLISNAIDSYETTRKLPKNRRVRIYLSKKKRHADIRVADQGCGIPKKHIGHVFDPLFTTKNHHKGMGIGLSNTKHIVQGRFKGNITVKSTEGRGSEFTITFPLLGKIRKMKVRPDQP